MAEALQHRRGEIPKAAVGTVEVPAAFLVAGNVWGRIIEAWPSAHLIGKTATPERLAAGIQTASLSLYLQMVGRALRPAPGKNEAVILDQVGNAHRHGLPTDEREWNLDGRRRRQGVSIPIQDGPVCFCSCPSAAQVCPDCGHLFLAEERDGQRRGLQQLEGELVEVTGPDPTSSSGPGARTRLPVAGPSSSCWSGNRSTATRAAGPGTCGRPGMRYSPFGKYLPMDVLVARDGARSKGQPSRSGEHVLNRITPLAGEGFHGGSGGELLQGLGDR